MAAKQDSSGKNTQNILVGIVIALAMSAAYYVFYYTPSKKKIESMRGEVVAEEKALHTARTQAPLLKPMKDKVSWLEEQLDICRAKIAAKGEVISLIKTIEGEAQRLGLKVINMYTKTEAPPQPAGDSASGKKDTQPVQQTAYSKVILDSYIQADYYKLEDFLSTLQGLESFIVIEKIDISTSKEIDPELTLGLQLSLYSKKDADNTYVAKVEK